MKNNYVVYLLECIDKTLYCGITNNLENRLIKHNKGVASKYTRGRIPVKLIGTINCTDKSSALKLEYQIKKLSKKQKLERF